MKGRIFNLMLILNIISVLVLGLSACGEEATTTNESLAYEISDSGDYYIVTGIGNVTSSNVVIPSTYKSLPVKEIAQSAFKDVTQMQTIEIPDSMEYIGANAFLGCSNLSYNDDKYARYLGNSDNPYLCLVQAINKKIISCVINKNTKIICPNAFYDCLSLTYIKIVGSVVCIGESAFDYANPDYLSSVNFENPVGWKAGDTSINSVDLQDYSKAATYLKLTYLRVRWTRTAV